MQKQWNKIKLGNISEVIGGGTPSTKNYDFWNGNIPWLTPKDLSGYNNRYISRGERNITKLGLQNSSARMLPKGAVLLTSRAPIGYIAIAENDVCTNQGFKSIVLKDGYCPEFFYYLLKNNIDYIVGMGSGSTFAEISGTQVKNLEFTVPPIDVQKKIAGVLGALDDKIELNNKINNNLEQQAQALFKSWFVDFEPFGGTMPDDWKIGKLEDVADFTNGYAFKSNELEDDPISGKDYYDVFKQGHIMRGGGLNLTGTKSYYPKDKAEKLGKYVLRKGDILMAMTDMKGNVAILGNTALMNIDDKYILNQRVGLLRCNNEYAISYPYVYILTNSFDFLKDLRNRANSGVQVNLSSAEIKNSDVIIPSRDINQGFNKIGEAIFEKIFANQQENIQLSALRDTLLPKLMSGEIDVSKVDINELNVADKLL